MKEKIKAYFSRPPLKVATDLLFWVLIVLMIIPSTRSVFLAGFAKVRTAVFSSNIQASDGPVLTDQDYQWRLSDLEGNQLQLEDFRGQVLFVNAWATWCPPCRAEMPSIEKLHANNTGVRLLAITNEEAGVVKEYIDSKEYSLPVYLAKSQNPVAFQSKGIPTTFIVNKAGQVVYQKTGAFDWNSKKIRDFLAELLAE